MNITVKPTIHPVTVLNTSHNLRYAYGAPLVHSHTISDVDGLQANLDALAASEIPNQSGQSGKYLTTDGTTVSWTTVNSAVWGNITGTLSAQTDLQTALDSKVDDGQVLTNVPIGAVFTDTTYDKASIDAMGIDAETLDGLDSTSFSLTNHNHVEADITDLDKNTIAEVDAKVATKENIIVKKTAFNSDFGSTVGTVIHGNDSRLSDARTPTAHNHVEADITNLDKNTVAEVDAKVATKEDSFTKNSAFNKDFGSLLGDVCEGNDSRLSDSRTPTAHTHVKLDITDFNDADYATSAQGVLADSATQPGDNVSTLTNDSGYLTSFTETDPVFLSQKGAANGVPTLGADSKIPSSQLPAIAISDTFVSVSQVAMLLLTAQTGDVCVRSDINKTFILQGSDPSILGDWQEMLTPTDAVLSVNGDTGAVTLTTTDITEGTNQYYTEARVIANSNVTANTSHAADGTIHFTQAAISITESQVSDLGTYETAFSKNTAFNKNYGTANNTLIHGNDSRLSDNRDPNSHTHLKVDITDFSDGDYATNAQGTTADSALQDITGESIKDLSDVFSTMTPADGQVLTYDTTNGWQAETSASGVTDHTLLTEIGTNNHTTIDSHLADGTIHFTQGSISITESQISDFGTYLTDVTSESWGDLSDVVITTPALYDMPIFDGTNWVNSPAFYPHFVDASIHYTQASISITESQVSDLQPYLLDITGETVENLSNIVMTNRTLNDVLIFDGTKWVNTPTIATHVLDTSIHFTEASISITESQISDLGTYEDAFTKNTAFNDNYGSGAGTVCEGNDSRLSDSRTPTAHTHVKADITDFVESDYATGAEGDLATSALQDITGESIKDLSDVFSTMTPTDGQILTYDTTNGWQAENSTGGTSELLDAEHYYTIWAEENAVLTAATYQWAFGNGANTPSNAGVTMMVPSGWTCQAVSMSLAIGAGTASTTTVEMVINGTLQGSSGNVVLTAANFATTTFPSPLSLSDGDYVNFYTTTTDGVGSPCVASVLIKMTRSGTAAIGSMTDVTITSNAANEILQWDGTAWINQTLLEAGIEPTFTKNTGFNLNTGTAGGTVATGDHNHTGTYEPAFTKNNAFNDSYGTAANTVTEGDDSRVVKFDISVVKDVGSNVTDPIQLSSGVGYTIDKAYYKCESGTITGNIKINTTSVTGLSALSISSTEGNSTATAENTVVAGDDVSITFTSDSTAVRVIVNLQCSKT